MLAQLRGDVLDVAVEGLGNGDEADLDGREPRRESARVVLGENADETFDGAELRGVDHDGALTSSVGRRVLQVEALGLVEVVLNRRHLPGATDRVLDLHGDLGAVEGGTARIGNEVKAGRSAGVFEGLGGGRPVLVRSDELVLLLAVLVARGQLEIEVLEAESRQDRQEELDLRADLLRGLLRGAVRVRVVLREAAHAGQAVDDAALLVTVVVAQLVEAQGQLAVRASPRAEDQVVHRAVHGLEVVLLACLGDVALLVAFFVDEHGREHRVRVVGQVTRRVKEATLGDFGGVHEVETGLLVSVGYVGLDLVAQDATLGVENDEAGADLLGEGVKIQLGAEATMVAAFGFLDALLVRNEVFLGGPGGTVDALELIVRLVALPVGGRGLRQREAVADKLGGGQVGAAAQVLPCDGAVASDVVIHGERGAADLDGCTLGALPLRGDELELVGLGGQLAGGLLLGDLAAYEALPFLDDALHALLEVAQQLGGDRVDVAEVVVEAVGDEGADAQVHVGEHVLHGLCKHVGGAVAQNIQAVLAGQGDGLDGRSCFQRRLEVARRAVDLDGDDIARLLEPRRARGPRRYGLFVSVNDERDIGHCVS